MWDTKIKESPCIPFLSPTYFLCAIWHQSFDSFHIKALIPHDLVGRSLASVATSLQSTKHAHIHARIWHQLTTKLKKQLLVLGNLPNLKYRTAAKIPPDSVYRCMQTMWSSALIQVSGMVLYMGVLLTLTSVTEFVSVTTSWKSQLFSSVATIIKLSLMVWLPTSLDRCCCFD